MFMLSFMREIAYIKAMTEMINQSPAADPNVHGLYISRLCTNILDVRCALFINLILQQVNAPYLNDAIHVADYPVGVVVVDCPVEW